jgi:hypothetical protein
MEHILLCNKKGTLAEFLNQVQSAGLEPAPKQYGLDP